MNNIIKKIFILILVIVFLTAFSNSYISLSLDNIATVVALAIDVGETNNLKLSFQFINPSIVTQEGTTEQSPSSIYTIEASSLSNGFNLMNTYISRELTLSHCKLIAFSEELCQKGISDEIYTLINDSQIRPSTNIIITKCSAKLYIENSKPLFENLLTRYYEIFSNSSKFTGYTSNATIGEFFNSMICNACEPSAILGSISNEHASSSGIDLQGNSSGSSRNSYLVEPTVAENIGLAVFKQDKLVGELNAIETLAFLATKNKINGFLVSIPDPEESNSYIDIYLTPMKNTSIKAKIINGSAYVKLDYYFQGRIHSMNKNSKYLDPAVLEQVSNYCNSYLKSIFNNYLYKTSKDLNSDISGIGRYVKSQFLTTTEFDNFNWNEQYKNSFFDVDVNTNIRSGSLLSET